MDSTRQKTPNDTPRESGFDKLVQLMSTLRGTNGCPWDKVQTLRSLQPYVLEEACELIDAMEERDPVADKEGREAVESTVELRGPELMACRMHMPRFARRWLVPPRVTP